MTRDAFVAVLTHRFNGFIQKKGAHNYLRVSVNTVNDKISERAPALYRVGLIDMWPQIAGPVAKKRITAHFAARS